MSKVIPFARPEPDPEVYATPEAAINYIFWMASEGNDKASGWVNYGLGLAKQRGFAQREALLTKMQVPGGVALDDAVFADFLTFVPPHEFLAVNGLA